MNELFCDCMQHKLSKTLTPLVTCATWYRSNWDTS